MRHDENTRRDDTRHGDVAGSSTERTTRARLLLSGWVSVNKGSHPRVHEALECISHDSGFGAGHAVYAVPERWARALPHVERSLANISEDDQETLCIGEETEASEIAERHEGLMLAHVMLNAFFDDWDESSIQTHQWDVVNVSDPGKEHPATVEPFDTWKEARDWMTENCYCRERRSWRYEVRPAMERTRS